MTEHIARFKPGQNLPVFAETQILAGRFVSIAGKNAFGAYKGNHTAAAAQSDGVAELDSAPTTYPEHSTDRLVNIVRGGAVAMVVAGAAIIAGAEVQVGTAGKAVTKTSGAAQGRALTASAGDLSVIEVLLYDAPTGGAAAAGNTFAQGTPQPNIVPLTDSTTGTANDTVTDVGAVFAQAAINNNFADLTAKINAILAVLDEYGMTL